MFIAMNRFRIKKGGEESFERIWKERDSYLKDVPGFLEFHLLKGPEADDIVLYSSHAVWENRAAFEDWTKSEAFRKAHARAGGGPDIYAGPPQLELFDVVLHQTRS